MPSDPAHSILPEVRQFIAIHIHSIEQLEVLLVLCESSAKSWSAAEVYRKVQSSEKSVTDCLESFRYSGLATLSPEGLYRFSPDEAGLNGIASALSQAYRERRVSVIECIYKRPSDTIQNFANAFRLRKER